MRGGGDAPLGLPMLAYGEEPPPQIEDCRLWPPEAEMGEKDVERGWGDLNTVVEREGEGREGTVEGEGEAGVSEDDLSSMVN